MTAPSIGLVVVGADALNDFRVFVGTLQVWHPNATLYVLTDSKTAVDSIVTPCGIIKKTCLDAYSDASPQDMAETPGAVFPTQLMDLMYEKATVLKWMFDTEPSFKDSGIWFMDADIVHLGPVPEIPEGKTLALCPHYIRDRIEAVFGRYNAGMLWMKDPSLIQTWVDAGASSRYMDQASLEDVAERARDSLHELPIQVNFGWWRMFQYERWDVVRNYRHRKRVEKNFTVASSDSCVGIYYDGLPMQSLHTHSFDTGRGRYLDRSSSGDFNRWLKQWSDRFVDSYPAVAAWKHTVYGG